MHSARIDRSKRLQVIMEVLKNADHPLSAEEIARLAYDFQKSGRIMLNISTNIGEMRSEENRRSGYLISEATRWNGKRYSWHDDLPRYWLIAAPGWRPRWSVSRDGMLVRPGEKAPDPQPDPDAPQAAAQERVRCSYSKCGEPVPEERLRQLSHTCCDEHFRLWRDELKPRVLQEAQAQGSMF